MSGAGARRRARELVLQGLYERQVAGHPAREIAADLAVSPGFAAADQAYFREMWSGVNAGYDGLLAIVGPKLDRPAAELAPIERALLVIGAWELAERVDIPYRAVIDEAIELAKCYGGTEGHRYVNAVLDKLAPELRAEEFATAGRGR